MVRWYEELKEKYKSGISNIFVVTGNIGDYAVPGITVNDFLIKNLKEDADFKMKKIVTYDMASGMNVLKSDVPLPENATWHDFLSYMADPNAEGAFIIHYPEMLLPNNHILYDEEKRRIIELHKVITSTAFLFSRNIVILMAENRNAINSMFFSSNTRTSVIEIPYPNEKARLGMIQYLFKTAAKPIKKEVTPENFTKLTAGLTLFHLEDIVLLAERTGRLTHKMIMEKKKELIKKEFGEVIEIFDATGLNLNDFSGQDKVKAYLREVVIKPILQGDTEMVPKGILFMGPPGTGKTYMAQCLAGEAGINFIEFKINKILSKWVGESEHRLQKAFACIEAMTPVGVFIDEMDQCLKRGDNETNSVTRNIFGMFLPFLSNPAHRGKVIWIGATNYPNNIDEALKRAGRFDKKIPFFPPSFEERIGVFEIHLRKRKYPYQVTDFKKLAELTEGYTQAEIENVIVKALEIAKRHNVSCINDAILLTAIDCMIHAQNERIEEMVDLALAEVNDKEFLPEKYWDRLERVNRKEP